MIEKLAKQDIDILDTDAIQQLGQYFTLHIGGRRFRKDYRSFCAVKVVNCPAQKKKVSFFLPPILSIYFICSLFVLDSYLLGDIFPEYDRIEPEYRPVEQATRLGYLFVAAIVGKTRLM